MYLNRKVKAKQYLNALSPKYINQISDLSPVASFTALETLDVSYNHIFDLSLVPDFGTLQALDASGNPIKDLRPLQRAINLRYLALANINQGSIKYGTWPPKLIGLCVKGSNWLSLLSLPPINSIIDFDGNVLGERNEEFESLFRRYIIESQKAGE